MPVAIVGSGSAAVWRGATPAPAGSGSAVCVAPLKDGDGTGGATVSRAHFRAWSIGTAQGYSRLDRWARCNATVGGQDVSDSLCESLRVTETDESPVMQASFSVKDPRVVIDHAQSISDGEQAVELELEIGPPGREEALVVFRGTAAAMPNDEALGPKAVVSAESYLAEVLDRIVCLTYPAFSGVRRSEILEDACAQADLDLSAIGNFGGRVIRKPFEYVGPLSGLLTIFGWLEGWGYRQDLATGGLEVVTEDEQYGEPVFTFHEEDGVSHPAFRQEPPSRPVTVWVLAGSEVGEPGESGRTVIGSVESGTYSVVDAQVAQGQNPWVRRYDRRDFTPYSGYAVPLLVRRLIVVIERPLLSYIPGAPSQTVWSARINSRVTTDTVGLSYDQYNFTDITSQSVIEEAWEWNAAYCLVTQYVKNTATTKDSVTSHDNRLERWSITDRVVQKSGTVQLIDYGSYNPVTDVIYDFIETWTRDPFGDEWTHDASYVYGGGLAERVPESIAGERGSGAVPTPPSAAAADDPVLDQRAFTVTGTAQEPGFKLIEKSDSELAAFIEDQQEARDVIARRFRADFAERYVVPGRILPHHRVLQPVGLLNASRLIETARRGKTATREISVGFPNADTAQRTVVEVPPSWAPVVVVVPA